MAAERRPELQSFLKSIHQTRSNPIRTRTTGPVPITFSETSIHYCLLTLVLVLQVLFGSEMFRICLL